MPDVAKGLSDVKEKVQEARAKKMAEATGTSQGAKGLVPAGVADALKTIPTATAPTPLPVDSALSGLATQPALARIIPTSKPGSKPGGKTGGATPAQLAKVTLDVQQEQASRYTGYQEIGGLAGRFLLAMLATVIVSLCSLLRIFQVPGLFIVPLVFFYAAIHNRPLIHFMGLDITLFGLGMFLQAG